MGRLFWVVLLGSTVGCAEQTPSGIVELVEGFAGMVAADEPRAVLVGRDVLGNNGNAVDAVAAMYFAETVTLPSSAGLGGGGVCAVFDHESGTAEAIDFLPRTAASGQAAVPGSVRGMAALHARYGSLRWEQLLVPAENLARFGTIASRALVRDMIAGGDKLAADAEASRIFLGSGGRPKQEGDSITQLDLAGVLSNIRVQGAGYLYSGAFAQRLAAAASSAGLSLDASDLHNYRPSFRETTRVSFGDHEAHFAPTGASGSFAAAMLRDLVTGENYEEAPETQRPRLLVESAGRADRGGRTGWAADTAESSPSPGSDPQAERLMTNYTGGRIAGGSEDGAGPRAASRAGVSGLVAADRWGNAVACAVTMNGLFGSGRVAAGTGIFLAASPGSRSESQHLLAPVVIAAPDGAEVFFAGSPSGGPGSATALVDVLLRVSVDEMPLEQAIAAGRVHYAAAPETVWHEPGADQRVLAILEQAGHRLRETPELGRVNALYCPEGLPSEPESCQVASDPRGSGLAKIAE